MGEVFAGRYELVDPIGRGGVGAVWRAFDHRRGRYVAAKVLQQSDAHALLRFVREQGLRIDHPHVLAPASWAADDDKVLFTMDLVRGGSLWNLIGDYGPLPAPFVGTLLDQLLSGLQAVHAEGVVHRDVKPANVLLEATGTGRPHLRLSDFGIAIRKGEPRLTDTGLVVGTPGYVAPEQLRGDEADFTADLYAVGLVGVHLLTGSKPDADALAASYSGVSGFTEVPARTPGGAGAARPAGAPGTPSDPRTLGSPRAPRDPRTPRTPSDPRTPSVPRPPGGPAGGDAGRLGRPPTPPPGVPEELWEVLGTLLHPDPAARYRTAAGAREALSRAVETLPAEPADSEPVEVFDQIGPLPEGFGPHGPLRGAPGGLTSAETAAPTAGRSAGPSPAPPPPATAPPGAAATSAPPPAAPAPVPSASITGSYRLPPPDPSRTAPPRPAGQRPPRQPPAPAPTPPPASPAPPAPPAEPPRSPESPNSPESPESPESPPKSAWEPAPDQEQVLELQQLPSSFSSKTTGPMPVRPKPGPRASVVVPLVLLVLLCLAAGIWFLASA